MGRLTITVMAAGLLLPMVAQARGVIWYGQYQKVESNAALQHHAARIVQPPGKRTGPLRYRCHFKDTAGRDQTISFGREECIRRGSHLLCSRQTDKKAKHWTGVVCWGDIYLKTTQKGVR